MPLVLEDTKTLIEKLDLPENWFLAYNLDTFSESLENIIKNSFSINAVPTYIEDELIGLKETLELTAQCYRNCLGNIINYLREQEEISLHRVAGECMKKDEKKKVIAHLKEDTKEYKEAIKEDAKLQKELKAKKPKKK